MTDIIQLCKDYLQNVNLAAQLSSVCGCIYCAANNNRTDIHEQIAEHFGLSHGDRAMLAITDNLDKSIGFDVDAEHSSEEISDYARKLYDALLGISGGKRDGES